MKLSKTGYRFNQNGKVIKGLKSEEIAEKEFLGSSIKKEGTYYFFSRKQGSEFIYTL